MNDNTMYTSTCNEINMPACDELKVAPMHTKVSDIIRDTHAILDNMLNLVDDMALFITGAAPEKHDKCDAANLRNDAEITARLAEKIMCKLCAIRDAL